IASNAQCLLHQTLGTDGLDGRLPDPKRVLASLCSRAWHIDQNDCRLKNPIVAKRQGDVELCARTSSYSQEGTADSTDQRGPSSNIRPVQRVRDRATHINRYNKPIANPPVPNAMLCPVGSPGPLNFSPSKIAQTSP